MNMPGSAYHIATAFLQPLVSNGLLIGILAAILVENLIDWSQHEKRVRDME